MDVSPWIRIEAPAMSPAVSRRRHKPRLQAGTGTLPGCVSPDPSRLLGWSTRRTPWRRSHQGPQPTFAQAWLTSPVRPTVPRRRGFGETRASRPSNPPLDTPRWYPRRKRQAIAAHPHSVHSIPVTPFNSSPCRRLRRDKPSPRRPAFLRRFPIRRGDLGQDLPHFSACADGPRRGFQKRGSPASCCQRVRRRQKQKAPVRSSRKSRNGKQAMKRSGIKTCRRRRRIRPAACSPAARHATPPRNSTGAKPKCT